MKKKLMMVAVLLGALSLGACVDDNESASVTNIRDAKAEQLRAMATLYQAQADAAASAAAAEAQLKAAEAAYQQALADAAAADAAMKEELIEQAKQKFALEIQTLGAQHAAYVAYWNQLRAEYENALWNNENTYVQNVYNGYVRAQNLVNTLTQNRMEQLVRKAQAEAQIVQADEAMRQQLAEWNEQLADAKRNLAKYEAMKAAQPSTEEYEEMLIELDKQAYDLLNNGANTALANTTAKKNAYANAYQELQNGNSYAFVLAAKDLEKLYNKYSSSYVLDKFTKSDVVNLAEAAKEDYFLKWGENPNGVDTDNDDADDINFSFTNNYAVVSTTVEAATIRMDNAFAAMLEAADGDIKAITGEEWEKDKAGDIQNDDVYTVVIDHETYYTVKGVQSYIDYRNQEIEDEEANIVNYQKVIDGEKAKPNPDKGVIGTYEGHKKNSEGLIKKYKQELETAKLWAIEAQESLNEFTAAKEEITDEQTAYKETLADFNNADNQKAYTDAIAALETLATDYVKAQEASKGYEEQLADLGFEYNENGQIDHLDTGGTYNDIKAIIDGIWDVQDKIDECNTLIAQIEAAIQQSNVLGTLVTTTSYEVIYRDPITYEWKTISVQYYVVANGQGVTTEDAIALIDANIAMLDVQIEAQQAIADKYKAQLDAYLNNNEETPSEPETPETPEEGGEAAA